MLLIVKTLLTPQDQPGSAQTARRIADHFFPLLGKGMVQLPAKKLLSLVPYVHLVALSAALYRICLPTAGQLVRLLVLHTALQLETLPGHHHRLH